MKIDLSHTYLELCDSIIGIKERWCQFTHRSDNWQNFDDAYYTDWSRVGVKDISIKDKILALSEKTLRKNKELNEVLTLDDCEKIFRDFLRSFFTEQFTYHDKFYGGDRFENEIKDCFSTAKYVLENKKFQKKHKKFILQLFSKAYKYNKEKSGILVFPLFFFILDKINGFQIGKCNFYKSNRVGASNFKKDYPERHIDLIRKIKSYKEYKKGDVIFAAVKNSGSPQKILQKSIREIHIAFTLLKVTRHQNSTFHSFSDNFLNFKKQRKELDGIFYAVSQYEDVIAKRQFAWSETRDKREDRMSVEQEFYYVDNFFQYNASSVRNCVYCCDINDKNRDSMLIDIDFISNFIKKNESNAILDTIVNAATSFSESRKDTNPIKQIILAVIALETIVMSEDDGESKTTEKFCNRVVTLLTMLTEDEQKQLILNKDLIKKPIELKKFVKNKIYRYRSNLVHGRHRRIEYGKNYIILNLVSILIFKAMRYASEEKLTTIKKLQEKIDLHNKINKII